MRKYCKTAYEIRNFALKFAWTLHNQLFLSHKYDMNAVSDCKQHKAAALPL